MQKSGLFVVVSGVLIVLGLVLLALGNQIILEGVTQGNGKVGLDQEVVISAEFDSQKTSTGIFAVQAIGIEEDRIMTAKILNPSNNEIVSHEINEETIEKEFDVFEDGIYKLVIHSTNNEEIHVFGAIGSLPDGEVKLLSYISVIVLIFGMVGLIGMGTYKIKNRKKSI
jgi:hypothetical protein